MRCNVFFLALAAVPSLSLALSINLEQRGKLLSSDEQVEYARRRADSLVRRARDVEHTATYDLWQDGPYAWAAQLDVGANKERVKLFIDTTYPNIVMETDAYDMKNSSSAKNTGKQGTAELFTLGAPFSGDIYTDTVRYGNLTSESQMFLAVNKSVIFIREPRGIFGLGPKSNNAFTKQDFNNDTSKTFFGKLKDSKQLAKNVYQLTVQLGGGKLTMGEIDDSQYEGKLAEFDMSRDYLGVWGQVNGQEARYMAFDSGSGYTMAPAADAKKFLSSLEGVEVVEVPELGQVKGFYQCDSPPPSIRFKFGDLEVPLSKRIMKITPVHAEPTKCLIPIMGYDKVKDLGDKTWIVGTTLLEHVSLIYDGDANKIRIGRQSMNMNN